MNERLKQIRIESGLNMRDFAEKICISHSTISLLETGKRNITDRTIKQICDCFDVNESWFRTGEGEMHNPPTREAEIAKITAALYEADPEGIQYKVMRRMAEISPEHWDLIKDFINSL